MTAEALQGKMNSVRSSGESEFLAELSLFALQKSSGATLYKWAKFLSILNIILTSQQNEQQLLPTNKNQRQTVDNLTARTLLNFAENISGLSNFTRLRAGSHYRQFGRKLITLWTKICQHISFLMRPLICDCSKIPKPGKNIRDAGVLGWGWPIFPNIEKPKEPAAKAVNSWKEWLSILTAKSRTWKRARSFIIHTNVFIACGSKLQLTAIKCREVSSIPSFRTWAKHPQFGLLWAPNKGNLRVTVTLFGRMASVVTEHNITAQISSVWWTLAFHLLKYNRMSSIYFHFRSEAIRFSSRFFLSQKKNWSVIRPGVTADLDPPPYQTFLLSIVCIIFGD